MTERYTAPWKSFLACIRGFGLRRRICPGSMAFVVGMTLELFSLLTCFVPYAMSACIEAMWFRWANSRNFRCAMRFWIFRLSFGSLTELQLSSGDAEAWAAALDSAWDVSVESFGSDIARCVLVWTSITCSLHVPVK